MGDKSGIEWTDATWNPVTGCTKVSEGCDHCYAERLTERFHGRGSFAEIKLHQDRLDLPLRWRRPRMVFVNSMSDLFHDDVPSAFIGAAFSVMALARQHTFQVLTKRPGRMASLVPRLPEEIRRGLLSAEAARGAEDELLDWTADMPWPLPNVWLGTSVETQKWAEVRILQLLRTPAAVRFLSCEPLLGPVDLGLRDLPEDEDGSPYPGIDWVIAGGESGPGARPMHPDWARSLRDQCAAASVPFFFKQWGEWSPASPFDFGGKMLAMEGAQAVYRVGKRTAGRELDGRTWDDMPETATAGVAAGG